MAIRTIPKGNAHWRFKFHHDEDTLDVKFGEGAADICRRNHEIAVHYDRNELPMGLQIEEARQFILSPMQNVLLHREVSVA